jgi:hypothetical protein
VLVVEPGRQPEIAMLESPVHARRSVAVARIATAGPRPDPQ